MKALYVGGSYHGTSEDIFFSNPTISKTAQDQSNEIYSLFAVKNKNGCIYSLYQHSSSTAKQVNDTLLKFE